MSTVMLITMVLCFALTISVAVSIGLASVVGIQINNANMLISVKEMFNAINKFPLAAIPFFILAGNLMETGGILTIYTFSTPLGTTRRPRTNYRIWISSWIWRLGVFFVFVRITTCPVIQYQCIHNLILTVFGVASYPEMVSS